MIDSSRTNRIRVGGRSGRTSVLLSRRMFSEAILEEAAGRLMTFHRATAEQHAALARFTVRVAHADEVDFVDVSSERVWIVSTEDMKAFLDGEGTLTHAHRHNNEGPIRFAFPRKAKFYTLANRIHTVP